MHCLHSSARLDLHAPAHSRSAYRPDIDGLRAVAVLAVLLNHLWPAALPGGFVGVDVFFVISGYLITRILRQEMAQGRFSLLSFYGRRARRILPALLAVCLATLAVGYAVMLPSDYAATLRAAVAALLSVSNLLFWREGEAYFGALEDKRNPLLHTWSLGVEEQFYLLYPAVLWLWSARLHGQRSRGLWLGAVVLASLLWAGALVVRHPGAVFYLLPFRAWELLVGAALALGAVPWLGAQRQRVALRWAGLAAIGLACLFVSEATVFPGWAALAPVLGAAAVIQAGVGAPAAGWLAWRPLVYLGRISYSLYLWHWPVIVFADYLGWSGGHWSHALALAAVSLALASLSFHLIEQPWRRQARPLLSWHGGIAGTVAGVILGVAVWGLGAQGFGHRFDASVVRLDEARAAQSPFIACFNRAPESACQLGDPKARPDTLLWGDSHALSWAVAVDAALAAAGRSALLVATSACPPFVQMGNRLNPRCGGAHERIPDFLAQHPQLRTVVLSGFWSTYFRAGGPITFTAPGGSLYTEQEGAARALSATVSVLQTLGRQTLLLGPAPVYPRSVPAALAMEQATGRLFLDRSRHAQDLRHQAFDAQAARLHGERLQVLHPMDWLCPAQTCRLERDGAPLYLDGHHLSPVGARQFVGHLAQALHAFPAAGLVPRPSP